MAEKQQYLLENLITQRTAIDRLWAGILQEGPEDCWLWQGAKDQKGYGRININQLVYRIHRLVCFLIHGPPIDKDHSFACHTCDNPPCGNPSHLFWGTKAHNSQDRDRKGRQWLMVTPEAQAGIRNPNAKLTAHKVDLIREANGTQLEIAKRFGISQAHVSRIKLGQRRAIR